MEVVVAGALAGLMHVLSGPDHLIAVAPLAMKRPWAGLRIGVHWGLGHAFGVTMVGAVGVLLRSIISVETLSRFAECTIGFVLIGVGVWAILQMRNVLVHKHPHQHEPTKNEPLLTENDFAKVPSALEPTKREVVEMGHLDHIHSLVPVTPDGEIHARIHVHAKYHIGVHESRNRNVFSGAFLVGILHGAAGTGHLLGVIPTLSLPPTLGAFYLGSFGAAAVVAMGSFGYVMGALGNRLAPLFLRRVMLISGIAAILIGLFWLHEGWSDISTL